MIIIRSHYNLDIANQTTYLFQSTIPKPLIGNFQFLLLIVTQFRLNTKTRERVHKELYISKFY